MENKAGCVEMEGEREAPPPQPGDAVPVPAGGDRNEAAADGFSEQPKEEQTRNTVSKQEGIQRVRIRGSIVLYLN